jgi:hypothetical protein
LTDQALDEAVSNYGEVAKLRGEQDKERNAFNED